MLNNITIQGRLARDPQAFTANNGTTGANFTIANQKRNKDTQFIRCTAFGKIGETVMKYLKKGEMINIEGELDVASIQGEDGEYRTYTDIIVRRIHFCGSRKKDSADGPDTTDDESAVLEELPDDLSDELPF